jgi:hypothetical protein
LPPPILPISATDDGLDHLVRVLVLRGYDYSDLWRARDGVSGGVRVSARPLLRSAPSVAGYQSRSSGFGTRGGRSRNRRTRSAAR